MILSEIRNKVKRRVDDTDIDTDFLNDAINEIYFNILNDSRVFWKFMEGTATFNTVVGQKDYTLSDIATDVDTIYSMYHTDGPVKSLSRRELDQIDYDAASTGVPYAYVEWDGTLSLYPTPSDVRQITVRYLKGATELADTTNETPLIPRKFQDILVVGTALNFYEMDEDTTRYDRAIGKYEKMLSDMMSKNETDSDRTYQLKVAKNYGVFRDWDYR